ncbi:MAG: prepilin-type N-terminal cleavage/methylation domain-containing protein [Peptococcaceae bacterium]|nr:prepilin-type N-terminal cleavage/methylation domain-containing protein [Peptococcaceae bacterium]
MQAWKRLLARENGFTLVEMLASMAILSVIGLSLFSVTGKANFLLAQQSTQMDARSSARSVLNQMVRDIQQASAIQVPIDSTVSTPGTPRGTVIQLLDSSGNMVKEYGYANGEIYLKQDNVTQYLIPAISYIAYTPAGVVNGTSDHVNMDIKISTGNSADNTVMDFTATATCRSVNANTNQFVPVLLYVSPNPAVFQTTAQQQQSYHDDGDSEDNGSGDGSGDDGNEGSDSSQVTATTLPATIFGQYTHFTNNSQILLVPHGVTFDPKKFDPTTGMYAGQALNSTIAYYHNSGQNNSVVAVDNGTGNTGEKLQFTLNQADVTNNTVYDAYVFTPGGSPTGDTEIVYKYDALQPAWQNVPPGQVKNSNEDQPDNSGWQDNSWQIDRGNINGFGSIDTATNQVVKKQNCNDKVAYYNQKVTTFDYKATVDVTSGGQSGSYALLTLFYNGENNKNGGWYQGFGISNNGVYYGPKDALSQIPNVYVSGPTTLEAIADYDSVAQQYRLRLFVNGSQVYQTYQVPSGTTGITPSYLGCTVTDGNTDATFTITP